MLCKGFEFVLRSLAISALVMVPTLVGAQARSEGAIPGIGGRGEAR